MKTFQGNPRSVALERVSLPKQKLLGASLDEQLMSCDYFANQHGLTIVKHFQIDERGTIDDRKMFQEVLNFCIDKKNNIHYLLVKEIGRFTRKGSHDLQIIKQELEDHGVELVDVTGIIGDMKNSIEHTGFAYKWSKYSPTRMIENYEADRKADEVRDILTRTIGAEINYANKGYSVRAPIFGLANKKIDTQEHGKRTVFEACSPQSDWVIKIFELRANPANTDDYIIETLNKMGFEYTFQNKRDKKTHKIIGKKGGGGLNYKRLHGIISNEKYAGITIEKWTHNLPVKMQYFNGLVSIDLFNLANRGKKVIVEKDGTYQIICNKKERRLYNKDNPLFPYKGYLLCDICGRPLKGSSPKGKSKPIPTYHCSYKHKYIGYNGKEVETTLLNFLGGIKFTQSFIDLFGDIVLEVWGSEQFRALQEANTYAKRIVNINDEIIAIKEKIKLLSSPIMIKQFEEDAEKLEASKEPLMATRNTIELNEDKLRAYIKYAKKIMEHPAQLVIDTINPHARGEVFSIFFDKLPTVIELQNGTPKLSCVFELKEVQAVDKSQLVTPAGFEPAIFRMKT